MSTLEYISFSFSSSF